MKFAKVIGQVISTRKEGVDGLKLALICYLDEKLKKTKRVAICTDAVNARTGDIVLVCTSSSARMTRLTRRACTDNTIVAIVDTISTDKKDWFKTALL
jgi:microcompartment protein CcmK/EutM